MGQAGGARRAAARLSGHRQMNALLLCVGWCLLLVVSWPLALLLLVLAPLLWLLSLPFRLLGLVVGAAFALLRALLWLPARLLGARH